MGKIGRARIWVRRRMSCADLASLAAADVFGLRRWYLVPSDGVVLRSRSGLRVHHLISTAPRSRAAPTAGVLPGHRLPRAARHRRAVAFVFLLARTTMSKFTPAQATAAIVVSYYWHFVDIVWIALFATIYFVR